MQIGKNMNIKRNPIEDTIYIYPILRELSSQLKIARINPKRTIKPYISSFFIIDRFFVLEIYKTFGVFYLTIKFAMSFVVAFIAIAFGLTFFSR